MRRLPRFRAPLFAVGLALAAACLAAAAGTPAIAQSVAGTGGQAVVQGTAAYRERIALPPSAVFEATLEDHSRADAPADVLAGVRVESAGQVPIRFEISYDPSRIQERHSYSVRGRITVGGELWFTTDRVYPVLTRGNSDRVDLMLLRVSASPAAGIVGRPAGLGDLPASFEGDLPAADGPGIRYRLDLYPDQAFALRTTYLGRKDDSRPDDIGNWKVSADGSTLTLLGGREAQVMFAIKDDRTLRKLDFAGREIETKHNYDLTRREPFDPIEPRLPLPGATLENTYWKLTRIGGKPAEIGAGGHEVFMMFAGEGRRVQGFSGCNRFTGGYELDGKRLVFKQMAGTRMACMEGMEQEAAFLKALESTASWEIRGEHLELFDAGGGMLMRFESRHMR